MHMYACTLPFENESVMMPTNGPLCSNTLSVGTEIKCCRGKTRLCSGYPAEPGPSLYVLWLLLLREDDSNHHAELNILSIAAVHTRPDPSRLPHCAAPALYLQLH